VANPPDQKVKLINGKMMSLSLGSSPNLHLIKSVQNGTFMMNNGGRISEDKDDNTIRIRFPGDFSFLFYYLNVLLHNNVCETKCYALSQKCVICVVWRVD